jgi:hypothetical protein
MRSGRQLIMVTINTPEDLLRVLREQPEWKATVRREILTEELMNLPARFDRFVEEQRQFKSDNEEFIAEQRQFNAQIDSFVNRTDARFGRLEGDLSNMKDEYSISKTVRDAEGVAYDMGFKFVRTLSISELLAMVARNDTADLATGDLRSFRLADLVIETADEDGATHYIAMEISYTADERDIYRTLRNARLLTRFTGHPAHAAVASIRNYREIQNIIDSGQVYWYELQDPGPRTE